MDRRVRRVRGGVESLAPPQFVGLSGRPFEMNATRQIAQKRAIAQAAVELCEDGDPIIINGGTTTFPPSPISTTADLRSMIRGR